MLKKPCSECSKKGVVSSIIVDMPCVLIRMKSCAALALSKTEWLVEFNGSFN